MRLPRREKEKSEYEPRGRPVARARHTAPGPARAQQQQKAAQTHRHREGLCEHTVPKRRGRTRTSTSIRNWSSQIKKINIKRGADCSVGCVREIEREEVRNLAKLTTLYSVMHTRVRSSILGRMLHGAHGRVAQVL